MKKFGLLGSIAITSVLMYLYLHGNVETYMQMKYGFPSFPMHALLSVLVVSIYVLYMYFAIYEYEEVRSQIIIRKGIKAYYHILRKRYFLYLFLFILTNMIVDVLITHTISFSDLFINAGLLFLPVLYLKRRAKLNEYFLAGCVLFIVLMRFILI